jgi:hypothetical protein
MSFSITLDAFARGTKDITRRLGWKNLKPGDHLMAVEKAQGLKKGEKVKRIGEIEIISCREEELRCIEYSYHRADSDFMFGDGRTDLRTEMSREGFPNQTPAEFVKMFCKFNKCNRKTRVNRIRFRKV